MIADNLIHANLYNSIHPDFKKAFAFIKTLTSETAIGVYPLTKNMTARIMEYQTGETFEYGWEAHKKFIDIQYCLRGKERIFWTPLAENLVPSIEYDEENDRTFFHGEGEKTFVDTGDGIFAVFFPNDAHAPQIFTEKPGIIKKLVVKVPVVL